MIRPVDIEGQGITPLLCRKRNVEDCQATVFDRLGKARPDLFAQAGIGFDADYPRPLEQIIFDIVAIVHAEVVDDGIGRAHSKKGFANWG